MSIIANKGSVYITYADGSTVEFPEVEFSSTEFVRDEPESWYDEVWPRSLDKVQLTFYPTRKWELKLPKPETKREKRARLIREMYPKK